jgi:hypothetical protein
MWVNLQLARVLYCIFIKNNSVEVLFSYLGKVNIQEKSIQTILSLNPNPSHAASQLENLMRAQKKLGTIEKSANVSERNFPFRAKYTTTAKKWSSIIV